MIFSKFAKWISARLGNPRAFLIAFLIVIIWGLLGPVFDFSESWQLFINTASTIIIFLMVFLLQNTQNRDTIAIHLKLDEIIRSIYGAHNRLLKVEELSDEELEEIHQSYEQLANEVKEKSKSGEEDIGTPNIK